MEGFQKKTSEQVRTEKKQLEKMTSKCHMDTASTEERNRQSEKKARNADNAPKTRAVDSARSLNSIEDQLSFLNALVVSG